MPGSDLATVSATGVLPVARPARRTNAAPVVVVLIVLLYVLPPQVVISGPLKSNGAPAMLVGMLATLLWALRWLHPSASARPARRLPVRAALAVFFIGSVASYAAAGARGLDDIEARGATRAAIATLVRVGVALYIADCIDSRERLETVLRWLVYMGAFAAIVGMAQFFLKINYLSLMKLPGFTIQSTYVEPNRSGFIRAPGTSQHPIEFGVVLAALLPIALHYSIHELERRRRGRLRVCTALILMAVPLTVARSAAAGLAIVLVFIVWDWTARQWANAGLLAAVGAAGFKVLVPGLIGTIRSLFENAGVDPSVAGRTSDYSSVSKLFAQHPWFGRGLGTFRPDRYFFLDNQWLLQVLEGGILGAIVLAQLFVIVAGSARGARLRSRAADTRSLGQGLAAAVMVFAFSGATFDEFSFYQASMTLFVLIGCCGALWRLVTTEQWDGAPTGEIEPIPRGRPQRRAPDFVQP